MFGSSITCKTFKEQTTTLEYEIKPPKAGILFTYDKECCNDKTHETIQSIVKLKAIKKNKIL